MRNRLLIALFGSLCCIFLMMSCGGGGGGGTSVVPCNNCIAVDTPVVAFGDVASDQQNQIPDRDVVITNKGLGSLIIGKIAVNNPVAAPFQIWSDPCSNSTLATGQICALKVRFSPTSVRSGFIDAFDIPSNDPNTVTVNLSGNGIAGTASQTATILVPASIAFGDVALGVSREETITVTNVGALNLNIYPIAPLAAPFNISTDNCSGKTLVKSQTCNLVVRFTPTTNDNNVSRPFYIPSSDKTNPIATVLLSGSLKSPTALTPPSINVDPSTLSLGNVVWNSSSEQTTLVQNVASVGSDNLVIGHIAPPAAPFSISTDNCSGRRLAPAETCPVLVRFSPTSSLGSGLSNSFFDIPSNDPNKPSVRVYASGNGWALRVSINEVRTNSCPDNISLLLAVLDKDGNAVTGLSKNNMSLSENGVSRGVTGFSSILSPIFVSVALALDFSGSMTSALPDVKASSKGFIDQLQPGDEAAVFAFSADVQLMQAFTDNNAALKSAIDSGSGTGEGTIVFDTLWSVIDNAVAQAKPANNRAIILISDGIDEIAGGAAHKSVKTQSEVIAHAQANQVTIFTIGLGTVATDVMTSLANETGGQYFPAPDSTQLGSIYTAIRHIIAGEYTMTYISSAARGGSVLLDVFVNSNGLQGEVSRTVPGCP